MVEDGEVFQAIKEHTTEEWIAYRSKVEIVTFTDKATTVENGSFAYAPNLKEANILLDLGTIEAYAFQQCPKLETVITGSIATMDTVFKNAVLNAEIPIHIASRLVSANPARLAGAKNKGIIAKGMDADIVIEDREYNVKSVMVEGEVKYSVC